MKAAVLKQIGQSQPLSENISIEDIPFPEINDDELLIEIHSASLNHRDLYIAEGLYSKIKLPVVLGSDASGVVHSIGSHVNGFELGDEVIINPGMNWGNDENFQSKDFKILGMPDNGTLAEYVKINSGYVHKKPPQLTFQEASAFPLAGLTAFRSVFKKAEINENDNVLITGIGGGVATFALLFSLKAGANVFVTSGHDDKIDKAVAIGAKGGANYNENDWDKKIQDLSGNKIDAVIDGTSGKNVKVFADICSYGARLVFYGATSGNANELSMHKVYWKQLKLLGSTMGSPKDFTEMLNFIELHKVKPVIDKVFDLNDVAEAFVKMKRSEQFGKIVINIK